MDFSGYFSAVARKTQIYYTRELKGLNLSLKYGEMPYIMTICEYPGLTQDEIAARVMVDKSTVAKAVKPLLARKLITCTVNNDDRRVHYLFPTGKAMLLYEQLRALKENWHMQLIGGMSELELVLFIELLGKIPLQETET
ncbi:MAG: MarR family transcriptional regulator [Syntrophomonadaceae bacterium]|nr:MarR family transcriptional regulator [Syntrophomonadaceae bacterium]